MPEEMDLGTAIDTLYQKRAERLEAEKVVKAMKSEELALKLRVKHLLDAVSLEMGAGKMATGSINYTIEPAAKNWQEIYLFIRENDAWDMLQKRLSPLAVKDRWDAGIIIPGIDKFDNWDLSLTKRSR